jgi:hypothetical protein
MTTTAPGWTKFNLTYAPTPFNLSSTGYANGNGSAEVCGLTNRG